MASVVLGRGHEAAVGIDAGVSEMDRRIPRPHERLQLGEGSGERRVLITQARYLLHLDTD